MSYYDPYLYRPQTREEYDAEELAREEAEDWAYDSYRDDHFED